MSISNRSRVVFSEWAPQTHVPAGDRGDRGEARARGVRPIVIDTCRIRFEYLRLVSNPRSFIFIHATCSIETSMCI